MKYYKYLLIAGLVLALWGINDPYAGGYNANNNYLTLAAKNYLRFGFTNLKLIPTYYAGEHLPTPIPYYLHHPILIFPLTALPFIIFGFHNWVVHVTNFLFTLGDIFLIYLIGKLVWNKRVGLWAAGLATIFPMTTFFWKYIIFEQGSLFFNLCVFYYVIKYSKNQKLSYVLAIFFFTLFSGFFDWGVLYLFVPLLFFYKKMTKPILVYLTGTVLSLGVFIGCVYLLQGGFGELRQAIGVHGYTATLMDLPFWPLRLLLITLLRFAIYFSPLSLLGFFSKKTPVLWFFFLYGCMNIFVLPTVTWENAYFLFYFIPFLAFTGALWIEKHPHWFIFIIAWSIAVNYFKLEQIKKQFWQYDRAVEINKQLVPYEPVVVENFSGDILEQYFFHPTIPITSDVATPSGTAVVQWYRIVRDFFNVGQL